MRCRFNIKPLFCDIKFDFDMTNSIFWYHIQFFWYHIFNFLVLQNNPVFFFFFYIYISKIYFVISKNWICDIIKFILWYHKFDILISEYMKYSQPMKKASAWVFPSPAPGPPPTPTVMADIRYWSTWYFIKQNFNYCGSYHFPKN